MRRFGTSTIVLLLALASWSEVAARELRDAPHARKTPGRELYWMDLMIPGYGSFRMDHPVRGGLIALGRAATVYWAVDSYNEANRYRSLRTAARYGDLYYGPGYRYFDPYHYGFRTTDEFKHRADRNTYYSSLAVTLHLLITSLSLYFTGQDLHSEADRELPRFDLDKKSGETSAGGGRALQERMDYVGTRASLPGTGWSFAVSPLAVLPRSDRYGPGARAMEGPLFTLEYRFTLRDF